MHFKKSRLSEPRPRRLLQFSAALFGIGGVMEDSGVTFRWMNGIFHPLVGGRAVGLSRVAVNLGNLVSNVPAILLLEPVVTVVEIASRRNAERKFWDYTKAGVAITVLTLAISIGWVGPFI